MCGLQEVPNGDKVTWEGSRAHRWRIEMREEERAQAQKKGACLVTMQEEMVDWSAPHSFLLWLNT